MRGYLNYCQIISHLEYYNFSRKNDLKSQILNNIITQLLRSLVFFAGLKRTFDSAISGSDVLDCCL